MNLSIYLPKAIIDQVKTAAAQDHRSVSKFIQMALAKQLSTPIPATKAASHSCGDISTHEQLT